MHHCFFFLFFYMASMLFDFLYSNLTGKNKIHIFSSPPSFSVWGLCTPLSWKESGCSAESTSELTALQPGRCLIRNILELLSETQPSLNVYSCEPVAWREFEREMVCWCVCVCEILVIGAGLIWHISDATHTEWRAQIYFWHEVPLLMQLYVQNECLKTSWSWVSSRLIVIQTADSVYFGGLAHSNSLSLDGWHS